WLSSSRRCRRSYLTGQAHDSSSLCFYPWHSGRPLRSFVLPLPATFFYFWIQTYGGNLREESCAAECDMRLTSAVRQGDVWRREGRAKRKAAWQSCQAAILCWSGRRDSSS